MNDRLLFLWLLLSILVVPARPADPLPKDWREQHQRAIGPYTYNLRDADVVELHLFAAGTEGSEALDPSVFKIIDTRRFTGAEARRIAQLWRDQGWAGFGAACHEPVYGITFYRGDKKIFFGSICFNCMNVYLYADQRESETAGLDRESRAYPRLRKLFKDIWGK